MRGALDHRKLGSIVEEAKQTGRCDLANLQLTVLPPEIGQLTTLHTLRLENNQFTALPPEVIKLTRLQRLWLDNNKLSTLPPEIGQLANLEILSLSGNRLAVLPPEIGQLTSLETLTLSGNRLAVLPPEIGQLTSLETLTLSGNRLAVLPPEIGQLTSLQLLSLSRNQLTVLPAQLADLLRLGTGVNLQDNPLEGPMLELLERGAPALAAYLSSLEDAFPQYEAKILVVGEGNVGKTSLVAALCDQPFVEGRPATHGIVIESLALRHPHRDVALNLRTWDFGGQEVYRITHQFFFTQHALYIVVWKPREGQEQNEVDGWLRRIRLRVGKDSRVFIVATHCSGDHHADLDYPRLRRAFPNLLGGVFEVDNLTGHGITELRHAIAAEVVELPQMGQGLSSRWTAARDEILDLAGTEPEISFERFAGICESYGVYGEQVVALAELLHIVGQVVYYGNDEGLRDVVVLNPEWLTKAISYVLDDVRTRNAGGILEHAWLKQIWQNRPGSPGYPTRYHPYFLRLMEKFDISYRLEDDQSRSLVAQLTPYERPELPWDSGTSLEEGTRRLALVCELSEPVPGLVVLLTVHHHRASTGKHWRSGVFLRHPIAAYSSEAIVELRTSTQLAVEVRAPSPDYFFNVLRYSIEDLVARRWPGLTYRLLIPCPSSSAGGSRCLNLIAMEDLWVYREEGETHFLCTKCRTRHDLSALLTGFSQPVISLQPELDRLHAEIADVQSGINDLQANAADTADAIRRILRAVTTEISDCPRLFTLTPQTPTGRRRLRPDQRHYWLVLWCEHPGHWHPCPDASYSVDKPREWILRIAPYAIIVFKALQLVAPIASAVAGVVLTPTELQNAQNELRLMTALIAELPSTEPETEPDFAALETSRQISPAEGAAWRAVRLLIFEHDPTRAFGDLRRVQAPSGDYLWVCPGHHAEYDPGLPHVPAE